MTHPGQSQERSGKPLFPFNQQEASPEDDGACLLGGYRHLRWPVVRLAAGRGGGGDERGRQWRTAAQQPNLLAILICTAPPGLQRSRPADHVLGKLSSFTTVLDLTNSSSRPAPPGPPMVRLYPGACAPPCTVPCALAPRDHPLPPCHGDLPVKRASHAIWARLRPGVRLHSHPVMR